MARHMGKRKGFFSRVRDWLFGAPKKEPSHSEVSEPSQVSRESTERKGFINRVKDFLGIGKKKSVEAEDMRQPELDLGERQMSIFEGKRRTWTVAEQSVFYEATHRAWQGIEDPDKRDQAIIDYFSRHFGLNNMDSIYKEVMRQNDDLMNALRDVGALDDTLTWSEQRELLDQFYSILLNIKQLADPKLPVAPVIIDIATAARKR